MAIDFEALAKQPKEFLDDLKIDVAREILRRRIYEIESGAPAQDGEVTRDSPEVMAQEICLLFHGDERLKDEISRYTELADFLTDGVFSACIESWREAKH